MTDLTTETRTEMAKDLAAKLTDAITPRDRQFRPRVWTGGDNVRVYTMRGEYLSIEPDGAIVASKSRMTWGHLMDDVAEIEY